MQTGTIDAIDCENHDLCTPDQWLLSYETQVTSAIALPASIQAGLEAVLLGMLCN